MKKFFYLILFIPFVVLGTTFPVNLRNDDCSAGIAGTLSWAINSANMMPGLDTIVFDTVPGSGDLWSSKLFRAWNGEAYWTITLMGPGNNLPPLVDMAGVHIIGDINKNGTPDIVIIPTAGQTWCFEVLSSNNTLEGMVIGGFTSYGIYIHSVFADGAVKFNRIWTCYIGTEIEGVVPIPNGEGIFMTTDGDTLAQPVKRNFIGKQYFAGEDNVENIISGNNWNGVRIFIHCDSNEIGGNHIGVDRTGTAFLSNLDDGVMIHYFSDYNIVGTDGFQIDLWRADRNIISGNGDTPRNSGVGIYDGSMWNKVAQNFIGTDKFGRIPIPNFFAGVRIEPWLEPFPPRDNYVGSDCDGFDTGEWNLISGNGFDMGYGVYMNDTYENLVDSNFIGTDTTGTFAIPNITAGVKLDTLSIMNLIGRNSGFYMAGNPIQGKWNLISGNGNTMIGLGYGVVLQIAFENMVSGNWIGLNLAGNDTIPNIGDGVHLKLSSGNFIGSNSDGITDLQEGNYIAGNYGDGVYSILSGGNYISGNIIGRTPTGNPRGNGGSGVMLDSATVWTLVGGTVYNTIVHNLFSGVSVVDSSSHNNRISLNRFGYNGGLAIDLEEDGVSLNDPGDPDVGANTMLNFPVIDSAVYYGSFPNDSVLVWVGEFPSIGGFLELYKVIPDPSRYGEGDFVYGYFNVSSNDTMVVLYGLNSGDTISGIVSDTLQNTSEFGSNSIVKPASSVDEDLVFNVSEISSIITENFNLNYSIPNRTAIELYIVDQLGRRVATVEKGERLPGEYVIDWDCRKYLSGGIYFYILKIGDRLLKDKFVFIK